MQTVYAIKYDADNQVLHAVTGENNGADAIGLTFDASKMGFGQLQQRWNGENRVYICFVDFIYFFKYLNSRFNLIICIKKKDLKETHDFTIAHSGSLVYLAQLNGEIDEFTYQ
jgi:hypothetical protein